MSNPFPIEFPGAWDHWPAPLKRYLAYRVTMRMLEIHGPADLVKWSYAGSLRPNGERVPFIGEGRDFWPLLLEDARAWLQAEADRRRPPSPSPEDT